LFKNNLKHTVQIKHRPRRCVRTACLFHVFTLPSSGEAQQVSAYIIHRDPFTSHTQPPHRHHGNCPS